LRPDSDDFAWDLNRLRSAQADGNLVFVLGAGINQPYGLPMWLDLLLELLIDSRRLPRLRRRKGPVPSSALEEEKAEIRKSLESLSTDPLLQAAMVRCAYGSDQAWTDALRSQLTPRAQATSPADDQQPLRVIARMLVRAALKDSKRHIVVFSFNFDNLLESALDAELAARAAAFDTNPPYRVVANDRTFYDHPSKPGINIYHLHGFIGDGSTALVLDTDSYVRVLYPDHWSRDCLGQALTRTTGAALFLGLSLADPNLRLVLSNWSAKGQRMPGFYIGAPPILPNASTLTDFRQLAFISRTILDLYDEMLRKLQLVAYHLSSWSELTEILKNIETP